ncbi:MAG: ATP-dependent protease ATPase subunit HslU [Fimbriimonas sp.]
MMLPVEDLTPRQIVAELDRYIIGQNGAKRAVAVAMRNRYRRLQLPENERDDILPKNILMIGPTGVGKTEIARRLAQLARAPFVKVEATKFTEVGYVGRDVESMVRDLAAAAVRLVEKEAVELARPLAEEAVLDRLVDLLDDTPSHMSPFFQSYGSDDEDEEPEDIEAKAEAYNAKRAQIRQDLIDGKLENEIVSIEVEEANSPFLQVFTPQGMEEMGIDGQNLGGPFGTRRFSRRATVEEAKKIIFDQEAGKLIDKASLNKEAIKRAEQTGIIFIDEIDKVAGKTGGSGPDVSREGVQRDLLPVIEGSTVPSKFGPIRTDHILFIAAGAFHMSKPSDLIPELQGRLPIRVELERLSEDDFRKILSEPKNALTKQYTSLLAADGVTVTFEPEALDAIAHFALEVNMKVENIGARRLHTIMERLLQDLLFEAPETETKHVQFTAADVKRRFEPLLKNLELSRTVL